MIKYLLMAILMFYAGQICCPTLKERLSFQVGGFLLGSFTERAFTTEGFAFGVASSATVALYSLASKRGLEEVRVGTGSGIVV